jgi:hypothetical protein
VLCTQRMCGASFESASALATTRDSTTRRSHPAATQLPVTDLDQPARLPQIALHQLARPLDRALKGAPPLTAGANLPNVVVEDRLAAASPAADGLARAWVPSQGWLLESRCPF